MLILRTTWHCGAPADLVQAGSPCTGRAKREQCRLGPDLAYLFHLLSGSSQADLQSLDLAEPAAFGGLFDPFVQVGDDLGEPHPLFGIRSEHRAAQTCVFVATRSSVGTCARPKLDAPSGEMLLEFGPLGVGRLAVFLAGTLGAAPGDEGAIVPEHIVLVDGGVALGRGDVAMAEDLRGDVDGQAARDGFGGEDSSEVVRCEVQWSPVRAMQPELIKYQAQQAFDGCRAEDPQLGASAPLEQVRQRVPAIKDRVL
jgi:hypothetical protein